MTSFYVHASQTVEMCIAFVAFVDGDSAVVLSEEHQQFEWLSVEDAQARVTWPRSVQALADARRLLANGDAGPVEDALRVI